MRDDLHPDHDKIWKSGKYVGKNRPVVRVTVQRPQMQLHTYNMRSTFRRVSPSATGEVPSFNPYPSGIDPNKGEPITNVYANYIFHPPRKPVEVFNVASVSWVRTTEADVAEATLEFWNVAPPTIDDDGRGVYSWGRGTNQSPQFTQRWNHKSSELSQLLVPDNIIRTYEGYGSDLLHNESLTPQTCPPERDTRLVLTGVWMIDSVVMNSAGNLTVKARDLGRLLMDQQAFPPVVPEDFYPPSFENWEGSVNVTGKKKYDTRRDKRGFLDVSLAGSSADYWPGSNYHGHRLSHAMDGRPETYWLSTGNPQPWYRSAYEYVDIKVKKQTATEVILTTKKTGYMAYVSVKVDGRWVDGKTMPYHRDGRGRYEEGVPYVMSKKLGNKQGPHRLPLNKGEGYEKVTLIRVWLGNLPNFGYDTVAPYRAGISELKVKGEWVVGKKGVKVVTKAKALKPGPAGSNPGRVEDLTDIVKLLCGWAGFFWPKNGYQLHSDGYRKKLAPVTSDSEVLGSKANGRIWGDFQATGTSPLTPLETSQFDKKSLMDGVAVIREMTGFLFMIDESGAVQWRMPNIWDRGNWITGLSSNPRRVKTVPVLDERQIMTDLSVEIQSRSVREGIYVANPIGQFGAMVGGYNPNPTGLRRVGGWTDQNFASLEESEVMADLIAVRQLFRYRTDSINIAANPALQIDDQVQIMEGVTNEGFIHYIKGITSSLNVATGEWTYALETHWLGDDPNGEWAIGLSSLAASTISYIEALGDGPEWDRRGGS